LIDRAEIYVKAGGGGDGTVGFRREKFVPMGGPDGGDGGDGGDVVIVAENNLSTLSGFRYRREFNAESGNRGGKSKQHGKRGGDLTVKVPIGTTVSQMVGGNSVIIADLIEKGERVIVARGGQGGLGNTHYATSSNQAPRIAQRGLAGEEKAIVLDLKLLADVGLVGYPNAGKSTLLSVISRATPKIADYPFTTLEAMLGVVDLDDDGFVVADIPGLIEGAHQGHGLGHYFLRHIERTRVLTYLIDGAAIDPVGDMEKVKKEMLLYNKSLVQRPYIVAVNKIDLPHVRNSMDDIAAQLGGPAPFFISAATGEGVPVLLGRISEMLRDAKSPKPVAEPRDEFKVFRPQPRDAFSVVKVGAVIEVKGDQVEKLVAMFDLDNDEARIYLKKRLMRMGVTKALERAGAQAGDVIQFGKLEMEWI
jgi:GTP-binding protein